VVIRVADLEQSVRFYQFLGLPLVKEHHGGGLEHYSADLQGTILELYPRRSESEQTSRVRLGFSVDSLDEALSSIQKSGGHIISGAKDSPWGRRALIEDVDGHRIELVEER